ncbi:MAG: NADPH-dependent FMN reductase [Thermoleophilia bacterium]
MAVLQVVLVSTRPGRAGQPIARWVLDRALADGRFEVELVDLADPVLPLMDEPNHPRLRRYVHQHTRDWSARVDRADAFAFVMPEYNYGLTAPLKNAIDYLHDEWKYKPAGLVSYGGVSGGTRAAQMAKQVMTTLSMMPLSEAVPIPFFSQFMEDGALRPNQIMEDALSAMLDGLVRWEEALRPMREGLREGRAAG